MRLKRKKTEPSYINGLKERIYEYHVFELQKYELGGKKIITVIDTTFAVVKRKPEKKNSRVYIEPTK